jgi:two pore calcium channel protein
MVILYVLCVSDLIITMVIVRAPVINNFMKPLTVLLFLPTIRQYLKTVLYDLKDSLVVLLIIFAFIFFFAFSGYFLFQGELEGVTAFPDILTSYYNMLILLTTANFPDVMLPAYNENRGYCIFFIFFLLVGLYFLLNVLLAIVFDNYKKKLDEVVAHKQDIRSEYIELFFERNDAD